MLYIFSQTANTLENITPETTVRDNFRKYKLNKFRKWTHCILSIPQKEIIIFTDDVVFLGFFLEY